MLRNFFSRRILKKVSDSALKQRDGWADQLNCKGSYLRNPAPTVDEKIEM